MPLFIVNGPFAVGKSTVAGLLHQQFPLALLVSVDDIRRLYCRYKEFWRESLILAEEMSRAMARVALEKGHTAIIEGVKVYDTQLDPWFELGRELGVPVHEILLWSSKETVLRRARERGIAPTSMLNLDLVAWAWESLEELRGRRTGIIECSTEDQSPEDIVRSICLRIGTQSP